MRVILQVTYVFLKKRLRNIVVAILARGSKEIEGVMGDEVKDAIYMMKRVPTSAGVQQEGCEAERRDHQRAGRRG